jgi:plastocyanin
MRRLLLAGAITSLTLAVPAWAATTDVQVLDNFFSPSTVTIQQGDTVRWTFIGQDHSVTSHSGQAESFDSDPGDPDPEHAPGDTFSHTFSAAGSFTYFCKVHPSMTGRVNVQAPAGTPPPSGTPPPADTTAPVVTNLRARGGRTCKGRPRRCRKRPTRVSFALSEAATVRIRLKRSRGRSPAPISREGKVGANKLRLSTRRVRRGRYTLTLRATDAAGNAATPQKTTFRVR